MKWHKIQPVASQLLLASLKTTHNRILTSGLLVVLCYVSYWFGGVLLRSFNGSSGILLITAIGFALHNLWQQRQQLTQMTAPTEDRLLGHLLIIGGVIAFPFCPFGSLPQAVVCLFILAGVACSCWSVAFFAAYPLATCLICVGLLPKLTVISKSFWQAFMPPHLLESLMAWSGSLALRAIGQPAIATDVIISLPKGAVEVGWGCNGFNMAVTMAVASLVLGLFLKQRRSTIINMMLVGALLALLFNIPRIMLVTLAAVYWGEDWFHFWHSSWGSQIFVSVLFTIYYYVIMAVIKRGKSKPLAE